MAILVIKIRLGNIAINLKFQISKLKTLKIKEKRAKRKITE